MTAPADPYAAQRAAALETWTQYEAALYAAYLEMMSQWLDAVSGAVLDTATTTFTLLPQPYAVFSQSPLWQRLTQQYTAHVVESVLAPVYHRVLGDDVAFDTRPFVQNFIAQMANNLSGMPDQVFGLLGDIVQAATTNGAGIPEVQQQMAALFRATGNPHWEKRAEAVAWTTLHTAYMGGQHDAYSVLAEADPDTRWVHRWLSTDDARTRPTHREADGQVRPWGTPFTVGGALLAFPGDPTGPPEETVRCRCVELMEVEGEPTDMSNRQMKVTVASAARYQSDPAALIAGLVPGEPRGPDGRWIAVGSMGDWIKAKHPEVEVSISEKSDGKAAALHLIRVPEAARGKGAAGAAMRDLLAEADRRGLRITLSPEPLHGDRKTSKAKLTAWYKSLGFVENKGRNKDYEVSDTMYRDPGRTTLAAAAADPHAMCSLVACKQTGKPGLCKGQHRGGWEPGTDVGTTGDAKAIAESTAEKQRLDATAASIRARMASWTPEQRARAAKALSRYDRQSRAHQSIVDANRQMTARRQAAIDAAKRQADTDAREQDRLDKAAAKEKARKAAARKIKDVAKGLKPYQTSTKI